MVIVDISESILNDRHLIEKTLQVVLPGESTSVGRVMRYAVLGAGQRLRPILALRIARTLGCDGPHAMRAAAAIEMLHCASLIVDDLPCMDDDSLRRNRAAVHIEFGEAKAVLAAFALVALAAKSVGDQPGFQIRLLSTLDCDSLIAGQALDLELSGGSRNTQRSYVTALKTVPLFQLAAEAGTLSTSVSREERHAALSFGTEFGVSYQLVDDYLDGEIDDLRQVTEQFDRARECLEPLGERARHLEDLLDYLNAKIWEDGSRHR